MNIYYCRLSAKRIYYLAKPYIPSRIKPLLIEAVVQTQIVLGRADALPNFIIIGAQRGGSTSLYDYLIAHPNVESAIHKEIHFFDRLYHRGMKWYKAHFPSAAYLSNNQFITGEASPYYILSPDAARRIAQTIREVKIIVLLRNPINRAFSHYNLLALRGQEKRSFEKAVQQEIQAFQQLRNINLHTFLKSYEGIGYLSRCLYATQLEAWFDYFPKEQMLILKSEDLYEDTANTYRTILKFLDLCEWQLDTYPVREQVKYAPMPLETRKQLIDFFASHNERLDKLIGREMRWDRRGTPREANLEQANLSLNDTH